MSAIPGKLLQTAVHQDSLFSREGMLQRMFSVWFNGFVYNQIWEDPRVDIEALRLGEGNRVLTIASGGCNVLNYLTVNPAAVVAVDLNPYHMYLTRLKLAALEHLPSYDDFFLFFGQGGDPKNVENYRRYVRPHLDEATRKFWEGESLLGKLRGKQRIDYFASNFYAHARSGYFLRFVHGFAGMLGFKLAPLLQTRSIEEQRQFFAEHIAPAFDHWVIKNLSKLSFVVFSLGIPPQQYREMEQESQGNIANLFRERVRKLTCDFPLDDNYFTWQAIGLRYDCENRKALPDYLKAEHYDTLKANIGRVETHIASLKDYMKQQPAGALDRFVFLDSQDWMKPPVVLDLWQEIARVGRPGSRIIFRTASIDSPVEEALTPSLKERFTYEQELSRELFKQDRSAIYGGFHIYSMA